MVNGKGEAPVYVSYFVNGKTVERSTEVFVPVTQWDEKSQKAFGFRDAARTNSRLASIKRGYDMAVEQYDGRVNAEILRKLLDGEIVSGRPNPTKADFIRYALDYNQKRYEISKIGYSTYYNAKLYLNKFKTLVSRKNWDG